MKFVNLSVTLLLSFCLISCGKTSTDNSNETTQAHNATSSEVNASSNTTSTNSETYVSPLPENAPIYQVVTFEFIPYAFKDELGNVIGYDVDILHAISEEQGVKFNFTEVPYPELFSSLQASKYDLAMSGLFIFPERQKLMESGHAYTKSRLGHIVKEDSELKTAEEVHKATIAMLKNSPPHKILNSKGVMDDRFKFVDTMFLSFQSALNGNADAGSGVEANMFYFAEQYPENKIRFIPYTDAFSATVYAPKGETEVIEIFNQGLDKIKANGKYQAINKKWFGEHADTIMVD